MTRERQRKVLFVLGGLMGISLVLLVIGMVVSIHQVRKSTVRYKPKFVRSQCVRSFHVPSDWICKDGTFWHTNPDGKKVYIGGVKDLVPTYHLEAPSG